MSAEQTEFVQGSALAKKIKLVLRGNNVRCAVAFLGLGAEQLIPANALVICNLKMGGTNPEVIRRIWAQPQGRIVLHHDTLHSKVYLSDEGAVVASANLSANGLGLQGAEQSGWVEAGVFTTDVAPILSWFETLLGNNISQSDLEEAETLWNRRKSALPPLSGLSQIDLDVAAENYLLCWWSDNPKARSDYDAVRSAVGPVDDTEIGNNSFDVSNEDNDDAIRGKHLLFFKRSDKGRAKRGLYWCFANRELRKGLIDESQPSDSNNRIRPLWVGCFPRQNDPVKLTKADEKIILSLLNDTKYELLRSEDWEPYFTEERLGLMRQFWAEARRAANGG